MSFAAGDVQPVKMQLLSRLSVFAHRLLLQNVLAQSERGVFKIQSLLVTSNSDVIGKYGHTQLAGNACQRRR